MDARGRITALARAMERDLRDNILPFWTGRVPDERHGGFLGWIGDDLTVDPEAPKGGVLNSRILWTFAAAFRRFGDPAYREMAHRAFAFLRDRFWDEAHGGVLWMLDHEGRPLSDRKQTYNLAFAIYGLAEYARATGETSARNRAVALYQTVEEHAADRVHGGYWEARGRDWRPLADVRLSERDLNAPKSMNTHLHVMEAYTNLLRAWDDPGLRSHLASLVALHLERIVDPRSGHLQLFFDEEWRPIDAASSFGHDVEASWLLVEAAEAVGDAPLRDEARRVATRLARVTLAEGLDREHGGLFAERAADGRLDDEKHWWMGALGRPAFPRRGRGRLAIRRPLPRRPRPRRVALAGPPRRPGSPRATQGRALEVPLSQLPRRPRGDEPRRAPRGRARRRHLIQWRSPLTADRMST
jgi:mannobiose 2-epimerase